MSIAVGIFLIVVLTAATGYFVAQEFAYVSVDRGRVRHRAEAGDRAAERALRVCGRLSFTLSGAQLGITVTALLVGFVAEPFIGEGLADLLGMAGLGEAASVSVSVAAALVFATVVQMVFGELAPKNWAIASPDSLACALSRSTLWYLAVAGPVIRVFDTAATRLLRRVGVEPIEELPQGATPEDLRRIVAESAVRGGIDRDVSGLLRRGLGFRELTAEQAMTPRVHVRTIDAGAPVTDAIELMDSGYSRFPIMGRDSDEIVGVVGAKEIMTVPASERATTPVGAVGSRPVLVPASIPLPQVLDLLRREHRQLACVADEHGGFAGVITLEDIAEEIVGQIRDEDDPFEPVPTRQRDGSWELSGRLRIDEVREATGIDLPDGDYGTLSGLIMTRLGRIPLPGDDIAVELDHAADDERREALRVVSLRVQTVNRHVPAVVIMGAPSREVGA